MKALSYAAFAVATLLSSSAFAGAPMHRLAASPSETQPTFELRTDGMPEPGKPLVVSLVDQASGKLVTDGQVVVLRPVYRGQKAIPSVQWIAETLPQTADGQFVCAAEHHATSVTLRGAGPAGAAPVWLTLSTHS